MTSNQTKKLMVKAKAMYHVADLNLTIRRGEVVELAEGDANKSNDLWRGQQFGLLEVKWVYAGQQVAVPKAKTVTVESMAHLKAHTQALAPKPMVEVKPAVTPNESNEVKQALQDLRADLNALTKQTQQAKAELQAEIARLEAKLTEMGEPAKKRGPKAKEAGDAGVE